MENRALQARGFARFLHRVDRDRLREAARPRLGQRSNERDIEVIVADVGCRRRYSIPIGITDVAKAPFTPEAFVIEGLAPHFHGDSVACSIDIGRCVPQFGTINPSIFETLKWNRSAHLLAYHSVRLRYVNPAMRGKDCRALGLLRPPAIARDQHAELWFIT